MKKDDLTIKNIVSAEENNRVKKFWTQTFLIYAGIEVLILATQYVITYSKCAVCVLPPAFYLVNWLQHLLFTGLLWYCLNRIYYFPLWKIVLLNILLFAAHYFLWMVVLYVIFNSGPDWLIWEEIAPKVFCIVCIWFMDRYWQICSETFSILYVEVLF